jgi:adenylate cyclase class 2
MGLYFPRNRAATSDAKRPKTMPSASTTHHLSALSERLALYVYFFTILTPVRSSESGITKGNHRASQGKNNKFRATALTDIEHLAYIHIKSMMRRTDMPSNKQPLEIEVKFHLADPQPIRSKLLDIAKEHHQKVFETNRRYENDTQSLKLSGKLLRLRHDRSWKLTYKSKVLRSDTQFKVMNEWEVSVDDGDGMHAILESLGFKTVQIYEKWRETFLVNTTAICIDTMPFGTFLEIEGDKAAILESADCLGLKWEKRILANYLAIFDVLREKEHLPFYDVTFDNFKGRGITIIPYLENFYPK